MIRLRDSDLLGGDAGGRRELAGQDRWLQLPILADGGHGSIRDADPELEIWRFAMAGGLIQPNGSEPAKQALVGEGIQAGRWTAWKKQRKPGTSAGRPAAG